MNHELLQHCVYINAWVQSLHQCVYKYLFKYINIFIYTYKCTFFYIYTYIYMYMYIRKYLCCSRSLCSKERDWQKVQRYNHRSGICQYLYIQGDTCHLACHFYDCTLVPLPSSFFRAKGTRSTLPEQNEEY